MIHLLVRPDYALLSDDNGYSRRVDANFSTTPALDLHTSAEIHRWLGNHPATFLENTKPLGYTKTEEPLLLVPLPADDEIAFGVCAAGDPNRMVIGVGLCASPEDAMSRFSDYAAALTAGPEAFFTKVPQMALEAKLPSSSSLPEIEYPAPTCEEWVMIHHPHAASPKLAVFCHVAGKWQMGCPAGQSDWILACDDRQILDSIPAYEAGFWAQKLAGIPAPEEVDKQDELIGTLLREKRGYPALDQEPIEAPVLSVTPSAPRVSLLPDRGPDLTAPQQQR